VAGRERGVEKERFTGEGVTILREVSRKDVLIFISCVHCHFNFCKCNLFHDDLGIVLSEKGKNHRRGGDKTVWLYVHERKAVVNKGRYYGPLLI
jgi:hypothetical protein